MTLLRIVTFILATTGLSARFHLDELTKRVPFPFWLHSQFNFLNKEGLFSYFAPDITISRYCMSSIRSKPSKQLLIVCQTKRLVDAVWTTSRPQFTASKALFSRVFAGFDELEWDQCFLTFSKMSKNLRQCRDDVDREWKSGGWSVIISVRCLFTYNPCAVSALRWRKTWILGGFWRKQRFLMFTFIWTHADITEQSFTAHFIPIALSTVHLPQKQYFCASLF